MIGLDVTIHNFIVKKNQHVSSNRKREVEDTECEVRSGFSKATLEGGLVVPNSYVTSGAEKNTVLNFWIDNLTYLDDVLASFKLFVT